MDFKNWFIKGLAWELSQAGLSFAREIEQYIYYKELQEPIGTRRADFIVEAKVLVEIKAIIELEDVHLAQILNYLKAYRLEVGLLINFGSKSLTFKRVVLWNFIQWNPYIRVICDSDYSRYSKAHGGEIKVETKKGDGSEFVIQLPFWITD